jgi:hypothetical protein
VSAPKVKFSNAKLTVNGIPIEGVTNVTYKPMLDGTTMTNGGSYSGSATMNAFATNVLRESMRWMQWRNEWLAFWDDFGVEVELDYYRSLVTRDDFWSTLGIPPTTDARTIKSAYAAAIRQHPPEGDAAEFQRVREAYEKAMASLSTAPSIIMTAKRIDSFWDDPDYGAGMDRKL